MRPEPGRYRESAKGAVVADRTGSGDDDESTTPPGVTVPPWLRTGPTPEQPLGPATPVPPAAPSDDDPVDGRSEPAGEAAPNRITLGAGSPAQPSRNPPAQPSREPEESGATDDLSTLPLRAPEPGTGAPHRAEPPEHTEQPEQAAADQQTDPAAPGPVSVRAPAGSIGEIPRSRMAWLVVAGVAVLAGSGVLGYFLVRGVMDAPADPVPAAACAAAEEPDRVVGDGPGSLASPAGAVLAFDHAYYVERSAEKAFEAVAPSSRMSEEQLRAEGIERVPEGTRHCVAVAELAPTLLDVTLTEFPPDDEPPVEIRQRVRVAEESDGTWGIVSITPAG